MQRSLLLGHLLPLDVLIIKDLLVLHVDAFDQYLVLLPVYFQYFALQSLTLSRDDLNL